MSTNTIAALLVPILVPALAATAQTFIPLPSPPGYLGGVGVLPVVVGGGGGGVTEVVGNAIEFGSGQRPLRWTIAGGAAGLPEVMQSPAGSAWAIPAAMSADGGVVAGWVHTGPGSGSNFPAAWGVGALGPNVYSALPTLPGTTSGLATGVSADGGTIVGTLNTSSGLFGARWVNGVLHTLPAGTALGVVSADGQTAMGTVQGVGTQSLMRWTEAGGVEPLAAMLPSDFGSTVAAMAADGTSAVGVYHVSGQNHSWRWSGGAVVNMGGLPGMGPTVVRSMTADGSLAVGYGTDLAQTFSVGAVWTEAQGWRSFADYLQAQGLSVQGWTITSLQRVSADGRTFTGGGVDPFGLSRGFVVTIPAPGSAGLLAAAAILAARRRRTEG